jgi:hypothetical protein
MYWLSYKRTENYTKLKTEAVKEAVIQFAHGQNKVTGRPVQTTEAHLQQREIKADNGSEFELSKQ